MLRLILSVVLAVVAALWVNLVLVASPLLDLPTWSAPFLALAGAALAIMIGVGSIHTWLWVCDWRRRRKILRAALRELPRARTVSR